MANIGGNFVNPAYASPEQIKFLRQYAQQLMTPGPVAHWAQGVGNIARALVGGYEARQADTQEQQSNLAFQKGLAEAVRTGDMSTVLGMAGHPRANAAMIAALAGQLHPAGAETYTTPGAAMTVPAPSNIERTYPRSPIRGAPLPPATGGEPARPGQQNLTSGDITGIQSEDIPPGVSPGDYVKRGFADAGISPMQKLDVIQKKGQEFTRSNLMNVAGSEPHAATLKQDQTFSAQAPLLKQTVGAIRDDIRTHGSEISWGPQTETVTQLKRFVENYAPGIFTPEQISGISAADNLQKMSGVLGNLLSSQLGNMGSTDFSRQLGQGQVPNMHNSKEGALALADMIEQGVDQNRKLGEEFRKLPNNTKTDPNFDYIGWRQGFFNKNPIINPITHNPITQDLLKMREQPNEPQAYGGGWGRVIRGQ